MKGKLLKKMFLAMVAFFAVSQTQAAQTKSNEEQVIDSLKPFQEKWVDSFNKGLYEVCANMYSEDASFVMYHGLGKNQHIIAHGRPEINNFWEGVVNEMKLINMKASTPQYAVISPKKVIVSYAKVSFASQESPKSEAFVGTIHSEVWVKVGAQWFVDLDITEAR